MKERFITAYKWSYGATRKEALEVYRKATPEYINAIIDGFELNAKKSFYDD